MRRSVPCLLLSLLFAIGFAPDPSAAASLRTIPAREASEHVGERVAILGRVESVDLLDGATLLFLGSDPGKDLAIRILPEDASLFPRPPAELFLGKRVRVMGTIREEDGRYRLQVLAPDQIRLLDPPDPRAADALPTISWDQAPAQVGQAVRVRGSIVRAALEDGQLRLCFAPEGGRDLTLRLSEEARARFPEDPAKAFLRQEVLATGRIAETAAGRLELVVRGPEQLRLAADEPGTGQGEKALPESASGKKPDAEVSKPGRLPPGTRPAQEALTGRGPERSRDPERARGPEQARGALPGRGAESPRGAEVPRGPETPNPGH